MLLALAASSRNDKSIKLKTENSKNLGRNENQNLMKKKERNVKGKRKNSRRSKKRTLKSKGNKNNKKKNLKRRGQKKRKGNRRVKVKNGKDEICIDAADRYAKSQSWLSGNKNARRIFTTLNNKNSKNESNAALFKDAVDLLQKITSNGTQCKGVPGSNAEISKAIEVLSKCKETSIASCTPVPTFNVTFSLECDARLKSFQDKCKKDVKVCCGFPTAEDRKCIVANKTVELRKLQQNCLSRDTQGTLGNCIALAKNVSRLAQLCLPESGVCSASSKEKVQTVETFEEDGVVYQQKIEYDPKTKEAVISVPEHLDRMAITVVVGEEKTAIVTETSCMIEDTPDDLDDLCYRQE